LCDNRVIPRLVEKVARSLISADAAVSQQDFAGYEASDRVFVPGVYLFEEGAGGVRVLYRSSIIFRLKHPLSQASENNSLFPSVSKFANMYQRSSKNF